jgi:flagellar protein FlbT
MPLRVELKPFERIVIGESVIINSGTRTCFLIEGETPVLREKDTVTADTANTPARRLYYCVQMMYLKNDVARYRDSYLGFRDALREAEPASRDLLESADRHVADGSLYKALKDIRTLMKREEELAA